MICISAAAPGSLLTCGLALSRQASKVMIAVRREFARDVLTAQLFRTPTIAGLAAALDALQAGDAGAAAAGGVPRAGFSAAERAAGVPCSAKQAQMLALHAKAPSSAAHNMADATRLRGRLDVPTLEARTATSSSSVRAMAPRQKMQLLDTMLDAYLTLCWEVLCTWHAMLKACASPCCRILFLQHML